MLLGTVLLVGALSFMPAVVLGPIADHLIDDRSRALSRSNESTALRSRTTVLSHEDIAMSLADSDAVCPSGPPIDAQALKLQRRQTRRLKLFEPALVQMATWPIVRDARPAEHGAQPGHVPGRGRAGS